MEPHLEFLMTAPWEEESFYKDWLAQSYHYTQHSTRMLAFTAGWSRYEDGAYYRRSLKHIREEQGHEQIAVADLKALGEEVTSFPESGVTRALWETQFYKIQRNPFALLGYILALEAIAVFKFKDLSARLEAKYGDKANRFVHIHAEDDPHHVTEAIEQIEKCSPEAKELIQLNFDQTVEMYTLMVKDIINRTQVH